MSLATLISTCVLDRNQQIHTDSMRLGLLDLDLNVENVPITSPQFKDAFLAKVAERQAANSMTPSQRATFDRTLLMHYIVPAQEWSAKLANCTQAEAKKLEFEKGFLQRKPGQLKQKVSWENIEYNKKGGLLRATRVVSFLSPRGKKLEVRGVIDLSGISPELSFNESVQFIEYIQKIHSLMDDPQVRKWVLESRQSAQIPPKELRTSMPESLQRIALNFTYTVSSGIAEALLKI